MVRRESSRLTDLHNLSRKRRRFTCFIVSSSLYIQGCISNDLGVRSCSRSYSPSSDVATPSYIVQESMVPELHDMRIVCLLKRLSLHGLQIQFQSR